MSNRRVFFSKGPYCLKIKAIQREAEIEKEQTVDKKGKTGILQPVDRKLSFITVIYAEVKSIGKLRIWKSRSEKSLLKDVPEGASCKARGRVFHFRRIYWSLVHLCTPLILLLQFLSQLVQLPKVGIGSKVGSSFAKKKHIHHPFNKRQNQKKNFMMNDAFLNAGKLETGQWCFRYHFRVLVRRLAKLAVRWIPKHIRFVLFVTLQLLGAVFFIDKLLYADFSVV